ncbi:hypothetical protein C4546_02330 [Candidatus Parcubacteria bacterium]|jgi:hypothetical protein|nr:MAG: hypothetical protein C4546_02330 [Candidatus Parcubacteria bacterium]
MPAENFNIKKFVLASAIVMGAFLLGGGAWLFWSNQSLPQARAACGIENCHGMEITCGPNIAEICTDIYLMGDRCRQFASCGIVNNTCQQIQNPQFTACKTCVESCLNQFANDQVKAFECESAC